MRAVVFREVGRVELAEVPDPRIEDPADAIVRVRLSAICGSDLHFVHGKAPLEPGETIGHEAIGVIEATGASVERFAPGDRVVVSCVIACGACWFCRHGQTQLCEDFRNLGAGIFGGNLGGAQAELVRVPVADVNLLRVPDDLDDERALFLGDILTTGMYAAGIAGIGARDAVAVVGGDVDRHGPHALGEGKSIGGELQREDLLRSPGERCLDGEEAHRTCSHDGDGVPRSDVNELHAVVAGGEDVAEEHGLFVLHALGDEEQVRVGVRDAQ